MQTIPVTALAVVFSLLASVASADAQLTAEKGAPPTYNPRPAVVVAAPAPVQPSAGAAGGAGVPRDDRGGRPAVGGNADGQADCALETVCLGPVVNLGVANPVGFGVHARVGNYLGFGIDYQFLPEITIASAAASASLFTIDARVYPMAGPFFLSAGFAYQTVSAVASASVSDGQGNDYALAARGAIGVPMLKLGLGFFGHAGFVLGIDVAVGVPLGDNRVELAASHSGLPASALAEADAIEQQARQEAQAAVDRVLDMLPMLVQVNLLRAGYVF